MTDPRLEQWEALADLEALERALTPEESRLKAQLSSSLPELAAEDECYDALHSALERAPRSARASDPLIRAALLAIEGDPVRRLPPSTETAHATANKTALGRFAPWFAGAALLLGMGWLGVYAQGAFSGRASDDRVALGAKAAEGSGPAESAQSASENSGPEATGSSALPPRLLLTSGEVRIDDHEGVSGAVLAPGSRVQTLAGQACLGLERSVVVCVATASEVIVRSLGDQQRVELVAGRLAARLNKQPVGKDFGVTTSLGTLVAVGTAFAVEVPFRGAAAGEAVAGDGVLSPELRVLEGTVRAETSELELLVHQGQELKLGTQVLETLDGGHAEGDRALLAAARLWSRGAENRLVLSSDPPNASVTLDDVPLGPTPLSVDVLPGMHEVKVQAAGYAALERAIVFSGAPISEHVVLKADPPRTVSPSGLLEQAREARQAGRFAQAAASYRELSERYGASTEAGAALLSLADLQLTQLNNPVQALASYGKYIRRGGSLLQEAYYGHIRALRALGRAAEERREIETFLTKHPKSAYAAALKRRLLSL
jgi:hypothetical protein